MVYSSELPVFTSSMAQRACVGQMNKAWHDVLHLATCLRYKKDAVIPHEKHKGIYYLEKGRVVLAYYSSCGHERTALYYEPGSLFNEARTFSGYNPDGQFTCVTDVECYLFTRDLLLSIDFIRSYPHLIQNLLTTMGSKILLHYSFLADMGTGSHLVHICRLILSLASKFEFTDVFPANMTQQEVADLLGVHRTTLARTLKRLCDMGIISKFTFREVCISNYPLLRQLAGK